MGMREWTADEIASMAGRLRQARVTAGFARATDAVRRFGWNYSRYMNYENGERSIPPKQALEFASAYNVTLDYIYFGKGNSSVSREGENGLVLRAIRRVPLVSLENIDELTRIACGGEPVLATSLPVFDGYALPSRAIFITIADRSMSHTNPSLSFEPGDHVLIDPNAIPTPSDLVLAVVFAENAALFRVYREVAKRSDGALVVDLVPLNPDFRVIRMESVSTAEIVGVGRQHHRVRNLA